MIRHVYGNGDLPRFTIGNPKYLDYTLSFFIKGFLEHVEPNPVCCNGGMVSALETNEDNKHI
jgi:hypothetical protein